MFFDPDQPTEKHRYRLPHWQQDGAMFFLTWRLADSLPVKVVEHLSKTRETWLKMHPKPWDQKISAEFNRKFTLVFEGILDDGHGACCLREHHEIVSRALHHFNGERYDLDCFVVMPNHVHVLLKLEEGVALEKVVHSIKRHTALEINRALEKEGRLWQADYWDRMIRSQKHLDWTRRYIAENPKNLRTGDFGFWSAGL